MSEAWCEHDRPRNEDRLSCDMMFRANEDVQVGDRFKRRGKSHTVYIVERFIEPTDHPRHVCLVSPESRDALTVSLSALLDGRFFERVRPREIEEVHTQERPPQG